MARLSDVLKDPVKKRQVVDAGVKVIEAEVADKGGLTGMAIKAAFKLVQSIRPGFVPTALHHLLDDFAPKIDPYWDECQASGEAPRTFFVRRGHEIANALLSVTDMRARGAGGPARGAYDRLRPEALKHVVAAMPRLADLVKTYAS